MISKPLTELLKKNNFKCNQAAQVAFEQLKDVLCTAPVLQLPDFAKAFVVEYDVSGKEIQAVLSQDGRPITFYRKALSPRAL